MAASGAKYGISTAHFYWLGAIPAMIFLAVFMMPFYYGSKARSVPEYLKMRFDERVRALNSVAFAVMTIFASGISMNALAKLLNQLLGWNYDLALWICSGVVLMYVLKGGLTSAIYTEVLQFFMIVLGFAPVVYLGLKDVGGWGAMSQSLQGVAVETAASKGTEYAANAWTSAWQPLLAGPAHNPMGVDLFAMVFGLGFVLSFGYWCTNFLVVQRAIRWRPWRTCHSSVADRIPASTRHGQAGRHGGVERASARRLSAVDFRHGPERDHCSWLHRRHAARSAGSA
jgi:SSS family solute:Na+ symporter